MSKTILQHSEHELLLAWGNQVEAMFAGKHLNGSNEHYAGVFHVGSSTYSRDYRDVDVRLILSNEEYDSIVKIIDPEYLRLGISLWGQRATGLPIDFDVQPMTYANTKYPVNQHDRHPLGIKVSALHNTIIDDIVQVTKENKSL